MVRKNTKKPAIMFITLSDIHLGHQTIEQVTKEFYGENGFFDKVKEVVEYCKEEGIIFGGIFITGDYFDHLLNMNAPISKFAMDLAHAMAVIAIRKYGGYVLFVQGTRSHDLNQLSMFEVLESEFDGSFLVINTVQELEIFGYSFLCIPEEYMTNQEKYYAPYFKKKYDCILGHGFFKFNCFNKNEVERPMPEMPIFDQNKIMDIARVTIFGHDHRHQNYRDSIYYNGSWSRLCHGEEEDKGALMVYMTEDEIEVDQLVNENAPTFASVYLERIVAGELNFESAVKAIKAYKKKVDFLKVKIQMSTVKDNPTMVELINTNFASQYKKGIVIDSPPFNLKNGQVIALSGDAGEVDTEDSTPSVRESEQYSFLFDHEIDMVEKIRRWVGQKHNGSVEIECDEVRDAISKQD